MPHPVRLGSLIRARPDRQGLFRPMGDQPLPDPFGSQLIQRCVIVQRDERGYGLTVSGDNPVFIQSVKDNGAAYRAGVQQGDRIIKVNGTLVTQCNHLEVVKMIRSGPYVALTLLGLPPGTNGPPLPSPHSGSGPTNQTNTTTNTQNTGRPNITNPQPADPEKGAELRNERLNTYRNMLEQEKQLYEKTRMEYNKNPTEKLQKELNGTQTRIRVLEQQLQKAYREGAYPGKVIPTISTDNSDMLADDLISGDPNRRKSDTRLPSKSISRLHAHHTRQRSTPETLGFFDDNMTAPSAGLKRNNSDVQVKDSVRQKIIRRGDNSRRTERRTPPNLEASGRVRDSNFSKSVGGVPDGSQQDSDMGDSPLSSPASHRRMKVLPGMEGLEALMNPGSGDGSPNFQVASEGTVGNLNRPQIGIISMEDDDFASDNENATHDSLSHNTPASSSDQQHGPNTYNFDDHGPFNKFEDLEKKPAHMAVFLHYLISNSDPSSLFFYLVTDSYRSGTLKEMKKWVYEIFSTFLAPAAPLRIAVPDVIVQSIENTTNNQRDNEDAMRNIFNVSRSAAYEEVKELLADFRNKRALGLGSIFGDQQLQAENMDRSSELKIVEQTLLPHLERLTALEAEKEAKNVAMAAALTTFLKNVGVRIAGNQALERCPSFTAREKRSVLPTRQKQTKKSVKGHQFQECHFYNTALCYQCDGLLWGIGNQGYQCQYCNMKIHITGNCFNELQAQCVPKEKNSWKRISIGSKKGSSNCDITIHKIGNCLEKLEDTCQGSKKQKKMPFKSTKDKDKKRPERTSSGYPGPDRPKEDLLSPTSPTQPGSHIVRPLRDEDEDIKQLKLTKTTENMIHQFEEHDDPSRADSGISGGESFDSADVVEGEGGKRTFRTKKNIGRSESLKGDKSVRRSRSDRRTRSDVDKDQQNVQDALDKSNTSSSSSLSGRSQDSPSASVDSLTARTIEEEYPMDSDMEADTDTPPWQDLVDKDMVKRLKPKEVKRQEIINELFHTEKTHVRTLKVLNRVFYQPMLRQDDAFPKELTQLLFPNLKELIDLHVSLNDVMKKERRTSHIIQEIGDMLLKRFDGQGGEEMKQVCATFCQNQKAAMDMLKAKEKKDSRIEKFISDAESNSLCQRLPLRGLISTGFQRLTKYPLLIENLLKYSNSKTEEYKRLEKVRNCSKELLAHVNTAIKECENQQFLLDISKKIDRGPLERSNNEIVKEFKNMDFTTRKLIHHGPLVWRLSKTKNIELYTLLLEDILVLLQKTDDKDKFILKCHSTTVPTSNESQKNTHSPIILLNSVLCRPVATNKYAFFLVSTSVAGPQIYELVTSNKSERKTWMDLILKAQEVSKKRQTSWRGDRRNARVVVPTAKINEEDEDKLLESPSPGPDSKAPPTPVRLSPVDRQAKTAASKQKPEEIEALLADSIRAKLPDDMGTEGLMTFLVTMSTRITPLLREVHEQRSCTRREEHILKAVEIMESKMVALQRLVGQSEVDRRSFQERCTTLQRDNDELQEKKERLQQELSASQHEFSCLNESMQQIRGDQPLTNADTTSYESLPTTDIDRTPDEDSVAKASNRLSYSGESGGTVSDSEGGELDEGATAGATAAPSVEGEVQTEQPVRIVANVVTETQPTKAHTAVELVNDQLSSLHRAAATELDKRVRPPSPEPNEAIRHISVAEDDEDVCATLGAPPPPPGPVEPDTVGGRTSSVVEYGDSDMEEALETMEEPPSDKTTQEIVQENATSPPRTDDEKQQQQETPTVHSQMEQSQSSARHSPDIPLDHRGEGSGRDVSSALRNNSEITTEGGSLETDKTCHIGAVDNDKQIDTSSPQPTRTPEHSTTDQATLQTPTDTSDMQISNSPTTSADMTTTSGQDSNSHSESQQQLDSEQQPQDTSETQPQDTSETQPQDTSETQPQDTSETQPQDTSETQPQDTSETQPQDTSETQPQDTSETQPQDTSETQPQDTSETQPQDTSETQPQDTSETQPQDTSETQPQDTSETQPQDTSETQPDDGDSQSQNDLRLEDIKFEDELQLKEDVLEPMTTEPEGKLEPTTAEPEEKQSNVESKMDVDSPTSGANEDDLQNGHVKSDEVDPSTGVDPEMQAEVEGHDKVAEPSQEVAIESETQQEQKSEEESEHFESAVSSQSDTTQASEADKMETPIIDASQTETAPEQDLAIKDELSQPESGPEGDLRPQGSPEGDLQRQSETSNQQEGDDQLDPEPELV